MPTKWRPGSPLRAASEVARFFPAADWLAASVVPPLPAADWLPLRGSLSSPGCFRCVAGQGKIRFFWPLFAFFCPFFYLFTCVLAALLAGERLELLSALPSSALRRDGGSGTSGTSAGPGSRQGLEWRQGPGSRQGPAAHAAAREQDRWMWSMNPDTSLTAMEKDVCENTHPEKKVLNPPRDAEKQCKWDSSPHGLGRKCHRVQKLLAPLCVVLSLLVLVLVVALVVVQQQSRSSHPQFFHVCPDKWISFQSKCYYFSEDESNWKSSLEKCKAMEASLTSIDSLEEEAFIKRCKGQANHWFGLHKDVNGQWRWTNGTAFNNGFEVRGDGPCAYLNLRAEISSALCHTEKYWICSRTKELCRVEAKDFP